MPATKKRAETISVRRAAERLGLDVKTVRAAVHRGELAGFTIGRVMKVSLAAVEAKLAGK